MTDFFSSYDRDPVLQRLLDEQGFCVLRPSLDSSNLQSQAHALDQDPNWGQLFAGGLHGNYQDASDLFILYEANTQAESFEPFRSRVAATLTQLFPANSSYPMYGSLIRTPDFGLAQALHRDQPYANWKTVNEWFSCVLGIEDSNELVVYPFTGYSPDRDYNEGLTQRLYPLVIRYQRGDIVFFNPGLIHAGTAGNGVSSLLRYFVEVHFNPNDLMCTTFTDKLLPRALAHLITTTELHAASGARMLSKLKNKGIFSISYDKTNKKIVLRQRDLSILHSWKVTNKMKLPLILRTMVERLAQSESKDHDDTLFEKTNPSTHSQPKSLGLKPSQAQSAAEPPSPPAYHVTWAHLQNSHDNSHIEASHLITVLNNLFGDDTTSTDVLAYLQDYKLNDIPVGHTDSQVGNPRNHCIIVDLLHALRELTVAEHSTMKTSLPSFSPLKLIKDSTRKLLNRNLRFGPGQEKPQPNTQSFLKEQEPGRILMYTHDNIFFGVEISKIDDNQIKGHIFVHISDKITNLDFDGHQDLEQLLDFLGVAQYQNCYTLTPGWHTYL